MHAQAALGGPYEMVLIITNERSITRTIACELKYGNDQLWPDAWQFCVDSQCWDYRTRAGFVFAANPETTTKFTFRSLGGHPLRLCSAVGRGPSQMSDFIRWSRLGLFQRIPRLRPGEAPGDRVSTLL